MMRTLLIATIAMGLMTGCEHETKKSEANMHWNEARAAVLASLARNQLEAGDFDKCRQTLTQAQSLAPKDVNLHILAAKLNIESGQLETAEAELAAATLLDSKNAEIDYLRGQVFQRWQKPTEALDAYTSASNKGPAELAYVMARAEMLVAVSRDAEALQALRAAETRFDHDAVMHQMIGQLLKKQGDLTAAADELRQANRLTPDDPSIQEQLALTLLTKQDLPAATDWLTRLVQTTGAKRSDLWLALGEAQMRLGNIRQARDSFATAGQLNEKSAVVQLALAKATLALGDGRRAEMVARQAIALEPSNAEGYLLLGLLQLRQSKFLEARAEFERSAALDKADPLSICMIGYTLEKAGLSKQAMAYYAAALKLKPNDELAGKLLAGASTLQ